MKEKSKEKNFLKKLSESNGIADLNRIVFFKKPELS